jgi:hypothetical protein
MLDYLWRWRMADITIHRVQSVNIKRRTLASESGPFTTLTIEVTTEKGVEEITLFSHSPDHLVLKEEGA